ncbi:MAG TPA: HlyD family efflux transporter periplasmic adaptor subunit, partial [Candidatus Paceibacterota bacterium]|nr:HlyD family efflux transporter periplasmic adaptor subunit [Candidatus Paceibacterota bacterium]
MYTLFRIISDVMADFGRFFWPHSNLQKALRIGVLVLLLVGAGRFFAGSTADVEPAVEAQPTLVTLTSAAASASERRGGYIGTVRSVDEAEIQTEVSGQVTSVRVRPGEVVSAGSIIATLENASEQAAVLQAEGAYEQALANAAINAVSATDAENTVRQAIDGVFNTAATLRSTAADLSSDELDTLVADENNVYRTGSVLLREKAVHINVIEPAYNGIPDELADLRILLDAPRTVEQARVLLSDVNELILRLDTITERFRALVTDTDIDTQADPEEAAFLATLARVESQVNAQRNAVRAAEGQLDSALEARSRAQLAASATDVSVADAQVKSALGSLRAAQAQLAKTILRSPIAGTVNDVAVNVGDFVPSFTPVAEVANNGSLEVQFFVTERDAAQLQVGSRVTIDGTATGTIVSVAPAVNQATQKTEIRAAVSGDALTNNSTVRITPQAALTTSDSGAATPYFLPITAVR